MLKLLFLVLLIVILIAVCARAVIKILEPRIMFHPTLALELNPRLMGFEFDDVVIQSGSDKIHGWFIKGDKSKPLVIFYHGNAGNISHRLEFVKFMEPLKLNFLMMDYKGYGRSEGTPSITAIEEDAIATLLWANITLKAPFNKIVLWGRSLGGSAALYAANIKPQVAGVIVESSFISLRRIANELFPIAPVALISDRWNNDEIVSRIATPKLFIHGVKDEIIPFHHTRELLKIAKEPKLGIPITNAGHNDTYIRGGETYRKMVGDWIFDVTKTKKADGVTDSGDGL